MFGTLTCLTTGRALQETVQITTGQEPGKIHANVISLLHVSLYSDGRDGKTYDLIYLKVTNGNNITIV